MIIEDTDNLLRHATTFYKDLFRPAPGDIFHLDPDTWGADEKLNMEDNEFLTRPFSEAEVKKSFIVHG